MCEYQTPGRWNRLCSAFESGERTKNYKKLICSSDSPAYVIVCVCVCVCVCACVCVCKFAAERTRGTLTHTLAEARWWRAAIRYNSVVTRWRRNTFTDWSMLRLYLNFMKQPNEAGYTNKAQAHVECALRIRYPRHGVCTMYRPTTGIRRDKVLRIGYKYHLLTDRDLGGKEGTVSLYFNYETNATYIGLVLPDVQQRRTGLQLWHGVLRPECILPKK